MMKIIRLKILSPILVLLIAMPLLSVPHIAASDCDKTSTGNTPLTEMGNNLYQGKKGGLYPDGNTLPANVQQIDLAIANEIQPLNKEGKPDSENGKIVFLSIGNMITSMEFQVFKRVADPDPLKNPKVTVINGAMEGVAASGIATRETDLYWKGIRGILNGSDLTPQQVQVVWLKDNNQAQRFFPGDAENLEQDLKIGVQNLKQEYVNLKIVYLSSSSYDGYDVTRDIPEPYAYETGFGVKWLIESQLNGDPELNYDPSKGPVKAPLLRWGPYLWADGTNQRKVDNLSWQCSDFDDTGTNPSDTGQAKVSKLLLNFLQRDPVARTWYLSDKAQSSTVEQLVFTQPFPIELIAVPAVAIIVVAALLVRFIRKRGETDEEPRRPDDSE
ncbi:MAG: hypothetical protein M1503_06470 [Thaumarchaeota archaeon]|nr:hypothetical protein [Nitrososphaerota archaeon]MCL5317887.1 hypothetical protein [Nitrososphaerota archaeon]